MAPAKVIALKEPTNGGEEAISHSEPYAAVITIEGAADFLFHRWNAEAVDTKAAAAKNSKAKKTDDVESYVYRTLDGALAIPGEYFRGSIINAAKFRQDPRSPRKSAMDLFKAGVVGMNDLCCLGVKDWDYIDRRRVMVQRNGITRTRPAFHEGWSCEMSLMVNLPGYINESDLLETLTMAGKVIGVGDFRPTYGRFQVTSFEVQQD